eukprot:2703478-Prymnesium_polylepis.1
MLRRQHVPGAGAIDSAQDRERLLWREMEEEVSNNDQIERPELFAQDIKLHEVARVQRALRRAEATLEPRGERGHRPCSSAGGGAAPRRRAPAACRRSRRTAGRRVCAHAAA